MDLQNPGNTDSVSQNFKQFEKHTPGLPLSAPPPHFLERIVAHGPELKSAYSHILF